MPVSITKSILSEEKIHAMVEKAFGSKAEHIEELTEGFFNIAYKIVVNHQPVILKVAPPDDVDIMTYEKNIMYSEVDAMRRVAKETRVPVAKVLFYDDSRVICESPYFFMEVLEGRSFSTCMEEHTEEEKYAINKQIGEYTRQLNQITNDKFGYYCQKDKQGSSWYEVFKSMLEDTYFDAEKKAVQRPVGKEELLTQLEKDRYIFDEVKQPRFVHWDIWSGNVFVKDKKVTGIIDFERCIWADELMEVGFRCYSYEKGFFDGYGIEKLTKEQERRAKWYDIYLFLTVSLECAYRQYDTMDSYHWACDMLEKLAKELAEWE